MTKTKPTHDIDETHETQTDDESTQSSTPTTITPTTPTPTTNTTTFPLTRTFTHCDPTGRELAHVFVTATVTLTRKNGITLSMEEIERRFRRNFHLSFKGGKRLGESNPVPALSQRPRRTMSPEHKLKLQEARQRRRNDNNPATRSTDDGPSPETIRLATTLLTGLSDSEWRGKSTCLHMANEDVDPASWTLAIGYLLDTNQIEKQGEKRGREYRRVEAATTTQGKTK